jgi:hypothetical protein
MKCVFSNTTHVLCWGSICVSISSSLPQCVQQSFVPWLYIYLCKKFDHCQLQNAFYGPKKGMHLSLQSVTLHNICPDRLCYVTSTSCSSQQRLQTVTPIPHEAEGTRSARVSLTEGARSQFVLEGICCGCLSETVFLTLSPVLPHHLNATTVRCLEGICHVQSFQMQYWNYILPPPPNLLLKGKIRTMASVCQSIIVYRPSAIKLDCPILLQINPKCWYAGICLASPLSAPKCWGGRERGGECGRLCNDFS